MAAGEAASTAVRARHCFLHLLDAWILNHLETLRDKVEGQRKQQAET
jgi:hypothetical protein